LFYSDAEWARERRPQVEKSVKQRLGETANWIGDREYLQDRFSAGDLLMSSVLRNLRHTDLIAQYPVLDAYCKRCEARPAFQKALRDQLADFVDQPLAA